jgi:quinolinate synthase
MKRNTLEKLYVCMEYELPEIHIDPAIIAKAKAPIDRMLEISRKAGL